MTRNYMWNKRFAASLFLCTALVLSGCKHSPSPAAGVRNSDGSITNPDGSITYPPGSAPTQAAAPAPQPRQNADGSITNPDGSVTYPAGSARAQRETSAANTQQAEQRAQQGASIEREQPAPTPRVIPTNTAVRITTTETLSASRNDVGDTFSGSLAAPILVDGAHFFERGTRVSGSVVAAKRKGRFKGAGDLGIELTSIGGVRVSTTEYEAVAKGNGKRTGGFIGGGTGVGALIGGLAGGGKGALIGGLAGAGAGTAGAAYTGSRDVIIPSETQLTFRLTAPVTLH